MHICLYVLSMCVYIYIFLCICLYLDFWGHADTFHLQPQVRLSSRSLRRGGAALHAGPGAGGTLRGLALP